MKISIYGQSGYFDKEKYTLCNEPLKIEIETTYTDLYAVCVLNGKKEVYKIKDGVLNIPYGFLTSGEMLIDLQQIRDSKIIKRWNVEKLIISNTESQYEAVSELATLRNDINMLKSAVKELVALVKKNNQL